MTTSRRPRTDFRNSQSGFIYAMDPLTARRQFQLSLIVVLVLGAAIAAAALNLHVSAPVSNPGYVAVLPAHTIHAERDFGSDRRS